MYFDLEGEVCIKIIVQNNIQILSLIYLLFFFIDQKCMVTEIMTKILREIWWLGCWQPIANRKVWKANRCIGVIFL